MREPNQISNVKHLLSPDLGDFTTTPRVLLMTAFAMALGVVSAFLALMLLRMIGFFTNLFFFGRFSTATTSPSGNHLGVFIIVIPVIGALIIGMMARFGLEKIRGHGIPEALEAILIGGSRIQSRVAILKPVSSAISIGSGGPFGAEGPIIMIVVKSSIWAISLGSGTSGGVLAPLLMMGGAIGALEGKIAPGHGLGLWPVIGMAAMLGGTMRAPLTALIFTIELTHNVDLMLPLLIAVGAAHCFTVLALKRLVLTEKVSRRGFHLSREYSVDPLEILFAREMMRTNVVALPASMPLSNVSPTVETFTVCARDSIQWSMKRVL